MIERLRPNIGKSDKARERKIAKKFLEEFSWLLNSYGNFDFKILSQLIEQQETRKNVRDTPLDRKLDKYISKNPNIHFLIGVLPEIFSDERIFPSNEHIVEFATIALDLPISRWEKRSRYELIGLIVCETAKLDDARLSLLVRALTKLLINDPGARQLLQRRQRNKLNWNEIIQMLTAD